MGLNYARLNQEDRRYWDYLLNQTRGGTSGGSSGSSGSSGSTGSGTPDGGTPDGEHHDGPYEDPELGTIAYDSEGHLLKKPKEKKPKQTLSRNTRSKLWSSIGGAVGTAIAGGVGGAVGSMLFSPRFRHNAQKSELPYTMNVPQAQNHDEPLSEPSREHKDAGKTRSQRAMDWLERKQTGSVGMDDYASDWDFEKDMGKYVDPARTSESIKSILTEAIKRFKQ